MFGYKINVVNALKAAGYNSTRIRREKVFAESTLQSFREDKIVSWKQLDILLNLICGSEIEQDGKKIVIKGLEDVVQWTPDN